MRLRERKVIHKLPMTKDLMPWITLTSALIVVGVHDFETGETLGAQAMLIRRISY